MSRRATLVLGAVALVLAGVLRWQVQDGAPAEAPPPPPAEAHADGVAPAAAVDRAAQVAKITGRPVFEPSRRPSLEVAVAAAAPVARTVPRVTGVVVSATDRSAIFASPGAGAGAATVAREGGRVGEYTVKAIAAGQVTLMGPDGPLLLRPVFDKNRPPPPAPPPVVGLSLLAPPLPIQR